MEKPEIEQIKDYVLDLEARLAYPGYIGTTIQLTELYRIIEKLMDATFKANNKKRKILLATLEMKTRNCMKQIEGQLAVNN